MRRDIHDAALRATAKVAFTAAIAGCSSHPVPQNQGPDCGKLLASTYPGPDDYTGERQPQSADVVRCCQKELAHPYQTPYHWRCCVAYNPDVGTGQDVVRSSGCTPWGPPVPPRMA